MSNPTKVHWITIKKTLKYLKGTLGRDFIFYLTSITTRIVLKAFCDIDREIGSNDRRSTSEEEEIYFGPKLVSWWSRKQHVVA